MVLERLCIKVKSHRRSTWSCNNIVYLQLQTNTPFKPDEFHRVHPGAPVEILRSENHRRWTPGEHRWNTDELLSKSYPPRPLLVNREFIGGSPRKIRSEMLPDEHRWKCRWILGYCGQSSFFSRTHTHTRTYTHTHTHTHTVTYTGACTHTHTHTHTHTWIRIQSEVNIARTH